MRYSEQSSFNNCPYRYKLDYIDGLKKRDDSRAAHHKNWGAAIHSALEAHYQGKSPSEQEAAFLAIYPTNLDAEDLSKTVANGLECLRQYRDFYRGQDEAWEVLATEHEGSISMEGDEDGERHDLHIDLIARHRQTGDIYFWDHKTTAKRPSPTYWKTYELSGQITRYAKYIKDTYGSCAGAIINNISVGHRKNKYMGEPAGFWVKFERQMFGRTPSQIRFWETSDSDWKALIETCHKTNSWPKHLGPLCSYCDFYELCLSAGDEQIRELLYSKESGAFNPTIEL